jgi:hypothetical protein
MVKHVKHDNKMIYHGIIWRYDIVQIGRHMNSITTNERVHRKEVL